MSHHYSDLDDKPMIVRDITSERNALYIILRDFLSDAEISQRIKDVYAGKYAMREPAKQRVFICLKFIINQ